MIRIAHRAGASLRQLAEISGLGRKTVADPEGDGKGWTELAEISGLGRKTVTAIVKADQMRD